MQWPFPPTCIVGDRFLRNWRKSPNNLFAKFDTEDTLSICMVNLKGETDEKLKFVVWILYSLSGYLFATSLEFRNISYKHIKSQYSYFIIIYSLLSHSHPVKSTTFLLAKNIFESTFDVICLEFLRSESESLSWKQQSLIKDNWTVELNNCGMG